MLLEFSLITSFSLPFGPTFKQVSNIFLTFVRKTCVIQITCIIQHLMLNTRVIFMRWYPIRSADISKDVTHYYKHVGLFWTPRKWLCYHAIECWGLKKYNVGSESCIVLSPWFWHSLTQLIYESVKWWIIAWSYR